MKLLQFLKRNRAPKRLAILDVNDSEFERQVIRRSYKTTVVVDYWAAWCVPCRQLGPVLERIAEEHESDFILAKLNTEHNQRTAAKYNIRSIPAVKAFRNGQVVKEFTGALPQTLVRRFISNVVAMPPPSPRLKASGDPVKRLKQAEMHLKKGRGFEAFMVLNEFPESIQSERAEKLLPLARFLLDVDDGDGLTGLDSLDEYYIDALEALERRKPEQALQHLIAALDFGESTDRSHTESIIGSLFELLGPKNRLTLKYQDRLAVA